MSRFIKIPAFFPLFFASIALHSQVNDQVSQTIELYPGWNLISIQVADPDTGVLTVPQFLESVVTPDVISSGSLSDSDYWNNYVQFHPVLEIWTYEGWLGPGQSDFTTPSQMAKSFVNLENAETRRGDLWRSFHSRRQEWSQKFANNLEILRPNKAYWVRSAIRIDCRIIGKTAGRDIMIEEGWNFLGFNLNPDSEPVILNSILGNIHSADVSQVWSFDAASGEMVGYDPNSIPQTDTLVGIEPGKGYWVLANASFLLSSEPQILLPADIDESPLSQEESFGLGYDRYTGSDDQQTLYQSAGFVKFVIDSNELTAGDVLEDDEDYSYDLNRNGIIDSALTQDTMYFPVGVDRQYITFTRGEGTSYRWEVNSSVPWLRFDKHFGVVSGAQDTLVVSIDRTGLTAGKYGNNQTAQFELTTSNGTLKKVYVKMEVPTVAGDWFGYAKLNKVNGKSIPLGKVDLFLNSSMESGSDNRFTTVLNSDRSLLFPRDVFMNGVFYTGQNFSVTTSFSMVEGDLNAPGYETFANAPQVPGQVSDYDADGDGVVDNMNPFPYRLNREITLQGTRYQSKYMKLDENGDDLTLVPDDRLEGTYVETVRGLLPDDAPILVEGNFVLSREEDSFEATKKTAAVLSNTLNQSIGGSTISFLEDELVLDSVVTIDGNIEVFVDLSFPVASAYQEMAITLIDPNGGEHILQQGESSLVDGGRYFLADFDGLAVTGNWTLRVDWNTSERGTLAGWSIDIKGTTSNNLSGIVHSEDDETDLIKDAFVMLTGTNITQNSRTLATGEFDLLQLNENKYRLFVWSPSHQAATVDFVLDANGTVSQVSSLNAADVSYADGAFVIGLKHLDLSYPPSSTKEFEVVAAATLNEGPGNTFYARLPEDIWDEVEVVSTTWVIYRLDLGNNLEDSLDDTWYFILTQSTNTSNEDQIEIQRYVSDYNFTAGTYRVGAALITDQGFLLSFDYTNSDLSTPNPATDDVFTVAKQTHSGSLGLTHWAFLGSLGARTDIDPTADRPDGGWGVLAVSGNTCYQESQPDSAAFDIDRYPFVSADNELGPEDTNHWYPDVEGAIPPSEYQVNTNPAHLRCVVRMGFPVFSTSPAAAGNYKIHPGWIDPQL